MTPRNRRSAVRSSARKGRWALPFQTGHELRNVLAPVDPQTFLQEYWEVKSLYIAGGADKFSGLFSRRRFNSVIKDASEWADPGAFRLRALTKDDKHSRTLGEDIECADLESWLDFGATVCVNDISAVDPKLSTLAASVKEQMNFIGTTRFNCYLSKDSYGVDTHFDARVAMTLQIQGKKRWRYSPSPAMRWPPSNAQCRPDGEPFWVLRGLDEEKDFRLGRVDLSSFEDVVLEPGDLLFLPAGTWHNTQAVGSSLALNLTFSPASFYPVLLRLLDPKFLLSAEWRGSPPPVTTPNLNDRELPDSVRAYLKTRLGELRLALEGIDLDDPLVYAAWKELISE